MADARQVGGPLAREPALLRLALLRSDLEAPEWLLAAEPMIDSRSGRSAGARIGVSTCLLP